MLAPGWCLPNQACKYNIILTIEPKLDYVVIGKTQMSVDLRVWMLAILTSLERVLELKGYSHLWTHAAGGSALLTYS
jgi:hypothetical protein